MGAKSSDQLVVKWSLKGKLRDAAAYLIEEISDAAQARRHTVIAARLSLTASRPWATKTRLSTFLKAQMVIFTSRRAREFVEAQVGWFGGSPGRISSVLLEGRLYLIDSETKELLGYTLQASCGNALRI